MREFGERTGVEAVGEFEYVEHLYYIQWMVRN